MCSPAIIKSTLNKYLNQIFASYKSGIGFDDQYTILSPSTRASDTHIYISMASNTASSSPPSREIRITCENVLLGDREDYIGSIIIEQQGITDPSQWISNYEGQYTIKYIGITPGIDYSFIYPTLLGTNVIGQCPVSIIPDILQTYAGCIVSAYRTGERFTVQYSSNGIISVEQTCDFPPQMHIICQYTPLATPVYYDGTITVVKGDEGSNPSQWTSAEGDYIISFKGNDGTFDQVYKITDPNPCAMGVSISLH